MPNAEHLLAVTHLLRPIEPYLAMPGITDICFSKPGILFIEAQGVWHTFENETLTLEWARALIVAAATAEAKPVGEKHPFLSAALPYGLRLSAVLPPACRAIRIILCFRVASQADVDFDSFEWHFDDSSPQALKARRLGRADSLLLLSKEALRDKIREGANVVVVGNTGSGKTAMLRWLVRLTLPQDRLVTIEDVHEIALTMHPNHAQLFYGEALGISASTCLRETLRLHPGRIILNECRGAEAFEFLQILSSGHRGAMTTFHTESTDHAIERLVLLARLHPAAAGLEPAVLTALASRNIDVVIRTEFNRTKTKTRMASVKCLR
jgi:type IV secretion system protein VirB11